MALPGNIDDREFEKFKQVGSEPAVMVDVVRTVGGGGGGSSATEYTDDSSFTVASDKGNAMGGIFTTDSIDSGDFGVFKINADRELSVVVENAGSIGSGSQYADGTTVAAQVGNVVLGTDGTDLQFLSVASNGQLKVDSITNAVAVTQSGTWNIGTVTTVTSITNDVSIDDGGNSITVDDGGSSLSVDDAGGSLTVDGAVNATQSGTWNIGTLTTLTSITNPVDVNLSDGAGTSIGSTGGALDINIASGTLAVTIDESNDSILVYGWDGSSNQKIKTDVSGNLQVDVLTQPALSESTDDILVYGWDGANNKKLSTDASGQLQVDLASSIPTGTNSIGDIATVSTLTTVTNNVKTNLYDGSGTAITSTASGADQGVDVNIIGGTTAGDQYTDGTTVAVGQKGTVAMGTDGTDLQFLSTNSSGRLQVDITSGGGSNDSVITDDSAFTAASDKLTVIGGFYTTDQVDVGDVGAFKINADRELATTVENTVDTNVTNATLAVTQSGTWNVGLNAGTNLIGKAKITDGTNDLSITAGGLMPISDNGGSITVDGTVGVTEIDTDDLDTGAGTDTQAIMGIAIPGSGGHTLWDKSIKLQDGSGTSISSTGTALDVNIASGVTLEVNLDEANDSVQVYGYDGTTNRAIKTDTSGNVQVDVLNSSIPVTQSGTWNVTDVSGTISLPTGAATESTLTDIETNTDALAGVTSTGTALDVNIAASAVTITADIEGDYVDDSAFTVASDKGLAVGGIFTTDTINSGDFGVFKLNADRELGVFVGEALPTGANTIGDVTVSSLPSIPTGSNVIGAVTQSGTWDINDISGTISLPTGAATAANQLADGHNVTVDNASGASAVNIQDGGNSITIDATALPLPTGAATEVTLAAVETDTGSIDTKLTTTNTKLTDIETNTDALAGVTSTGTALDVNVASGTIIANIEGDYVDDSAFAVGSDKGLMVGGFFTTDTIDSGDFGAFKINADRELGVFLGEAIPTGSNVIGAVTQSGTWNVTDISGTISLPTGAATEATLSSIDTDTSTIATKVTDIETNTDALATVTKTTVGADTGLDVNVIKGINVEVDLDAADDSVLVYGYDGSSNQKIKTDASGNVQVDVVASLPTGTNSIGDIATVATVTTITNDVSIDDGGNSITVDNSTLSVVGGGTEAAAQRVTLANNSTGVLSVDDNGGSLTVDGTVAATQSGSWTVAVTGVGGRKTPYTEESAGLPQNSIAWNSATSASILTKFRLLGITCKFGGIPTANDFIVSLGSAAAPLANVTYWSVNPGTLGVTDLSWHPDGEIIIDSTIGETLNINWTNAVAQVDWGLRVVVEEVTP